MQFKISQKWQESIDNASLCLNYMQTPQICQENLLLQWFTVKFKRGNYGSACGCVGSLWVATDDRLPEAASLLSDGDSDKNM